MTREEIKEELSDVILDLGGLSFSDVNSLLEEDFAVTFEGKDLIEIAEHFYNLPKKGLWDGKKVCKYLEEHAGNFMTLENDEEGELCTVYYQKGLVDNLRKAMDEG